LNDVYNGEIYGRYPGYYSSLGAIYRGYYGRLRGLGNLGLGYSNFGYSGLRFPGVYPGYGGYADYYGRPGFYR